MGVGVNRIHTSLEIIGTSSLGAGIDDGRIPPQTKDASACMWSEHRPERRGRRWVNTAFNPLGRNRSISSVIHELLVI